MSEARLAGGPEARRLSPWAALLLAIVAFAIVYAGVQILRIGIFSHVAAAGIREIVALRAFTSIVLIWVSLGAILLVARLRGQTFRDLGWRKASPVSGWLVALAVTIAYCAFTIAGPALRHAPILTDWSLFRVGTAVVIGVSAGICEESIFRGFVMTQARDGGANKFLQVVLSAVLFGLAHVGWGGLTGHFEIWPTVAAMVATMILGALLAITYLAARRRLMPCAVAHAAIDMVIEPWLLLFVANGGHFG